MAEPTVLVGGNVSGNITSCKIEQQNVSISRKGLFSASETNTYISYDVCNKQIIREYTVPSFTALGGVYCFLGLFVVVIFCSVIAILVSDWSYDTKNKRRN
jgi:hypothetical protein